VQKQLSCKLIGSTWKLLVEGRGCSLRYDCDGCADKEFDGGPEAHEQHTTRECERAKQPDSRKFATSPFNPMRRMTLFIESNYLRRPCGT
jgi:hypothetical protein